MSLCGSVKSNVQCLVFDCDSYMHPSLQKTDQADFHDSMT